ncbi:transposase [Vibrio sp. JC009]|uniref:transposase n=1 Tax=Vibrio sp. JC009 TaxID=2912314 RepID=UPI0023AF0578|nr:transposase [Vibrio sp. JC009]WED20684.1 transposase [Vibrio sp. JC009]
MTTARSRQVNPDVTPYYHVVSRCVRKTYLCGFDETSQRCYEHRREWIEGRIKDLSRVYCVDICAYAVMSNHYHLVVHLNRRKAQKLTCQEVIERWSGLHHQPNLIQKMVDKELKSEAEYLKAQEIVESWRERLSNLSWFMKELNQDIAQKANSEDKCKGHFWESRFKSQALMDEQALLSAMAYVDLNPVRAGVAEVPEESEHTSIKERIDCLSRFQATPACLFPFTGTRGGDKDEGISFSLFDYIELVDWTGRQLRENKLSIDSQQPPIMDRLRTDSSAWLQVCTRLESKRAVLVGQKRNLERAVPKLNRTRVVGYALN